MTQSDFSSPLITLGHISRAHGVHGAMVITPYGDDLQLILNGRNLVMVSPDGLRTRPIEALKGKEAAQGLIVKIKDVTSREEAALLKGWSVAISREALPEAGDDEVYWADLIGLTVVTAMGYNVGRVVNLMEAGAGLLLVLESDDPPGRERLIPYHESLVVEVDLPGGRLVIDPPPGLLEL